MEVQKKNLVIPSWLLKSKKDRNLSSIVEGLVSGLLVVGNVNGSGNMIIFGSGDWAGEDLTMVGILPRLNLHLSHIKRYNLH